MAVRPRAAVTVSRWRRAGGVSATMIGSATATASRPTAATASRRINFTLISAMTIGTAATVTRSPGRTITTTPTRDRFSAMHVHFASRKGKAVLIAASSNEPIALARSGTDWSRAPRTRQRKTSATPRSIRPSPKLWRGNAYSTVKLPRLPRRANSRNRFGLRQSPKDVAAWTDSEHGRKVDEGAVDISGLEQQLRQMTAQIESLRPSGDLGKAINGLRSDLSEIGRSLTEALPRRALESLEIEVKALGQRIDHGRQSGVDATALAGIERGLAEVCEALRGLTPAEGLVGFDEAVKGLAKKVDAIATKDDPAALQQLETAIGALRGIVSHVASNETLTKVAEDVRAALRQSRWPCRQWCGLAHTFGAGESHRCSRGCAECFG